MDATGTDAREWGATAAAWGHHATETDPIAEPTARMVDLIHPEPGEAVLEMAAGPGALAHTWSALVGPTGRVEVTDLADEMVSVARHRSAELANVTTGVADLSSIDRADASFDVVAVRMGLMFVAEPATALREIHRVLTPGGRLGVLTWGGLEHNPWMTCVGMAAMITGVVAGGPPVGPGGVFSLSDPTTLQHHAEAAGFADTTIEEHDVTFRAASIDEHIDRVSALAGPLAVAIGRASPDQRDALRRTAADLVTPYVTHDAVAIPGRVLLLVARP